MTTYPRVSYKSVEDMVLSYAGQDRAQIDATGLRQVNGFINQRLADWAWIGWPWPELTPIELRLYRNVYDNAFAYAAPTLTTASEVFFPPTQLYYQALRATTGNAPATLTGGTYVVNAAYWALASGPYTGPDWLDATDYAVGTIVRNPANNRFYQCYLAHTSSGSLDTTKFGLLTVFDPYVARDQDWEENEIGEYLDMTLDDPRTVVNPRRVSFNLNGVGAHVLASRAGRWDWGWRFGYEVPNMVWLKFRLPCPEFRGEIFDPLATYTAGEDTVYFEGSTTDLEGDYWKCIVTTVAGESPETTPASWERLAFPQWLRTPVARKAFADWLRYGAQREAAGAEDVAADDSLFQAQLRAGSQQGQILKWRWRA
jgi:hypothetical protein